VNIDVIGDVHGQLDKLVALLSLLGYSRSGDVWRHADRTAVFLGDLIDRGPRQLATVELVRTMVEAGAAKCILGNHEVSAIAWVMPDPSKPGRFLRDHEVSIHRTLHQAFLDEVGEDSERHRAIIAWFRTLPLWLDLGGVRIVHACWHEDSMAALQPLLGPNQTLTDDLMRLGSRRGHWVNEALGIVSKGPELKWDSPGMPLENHGELPQEVRLRWWDPIESSAPQRHGWGHSGPPVIFGHYWFTGGPAVISPQYVCLDYGVARDGPLVAYRWDGEAELNSSKIVWV
jgi:hypothetical protein